MYRVFTFTGYAKVKVVQQLNAWLDQGDQQDVKIDSFTWCEVELTNQVELTIIYHHQS